MNGKKSREFFRNRGLGLKRGEGAGDICPAEQIFRLCAKISGDFGKGVAVESHGAVYYRDRQPRASTYQEACGEDRRMPVKQMDAGGAGLKAPRRQAEPGKTLHFVDVGLRVIHGVPG